MKRVAAVLFLAWFPWGFVHADLGTLIDFPSDASRSSIPASWTVVFLPSGQKAGPSSSVRASGADHGACPAGSLEAVIDFSKAPTGTTGAVILPSSAGHASGAGLLSNVGIIRSIELRASSSDPSIGIGVVLADEQAQETCYLFGAGFDPDGGSHVNANPRWIRDTREREYHSEKLAYTPGFLPYRRLAGFYCSKPGTGSAPALIRVRDVGINFQTATYYDDERQSVLEPWERGDKGK